MRAPIILASSLMAGATLTGWSPSAWSQTSSASAPAADRTIKATLATSPEAPRAGELTTLDLALADGAGAPVDDLLSHHGRKLHVVLVSEDMQVFGHIHPQDFGENVADGAARVRFAFPRPGRYLAAADAMTGTGPYAEHFTLTVAGDASGPALHDLPAAPRLVVVTAAERDVYTAPVRFDAPGATAGYAVSVARPAVIAAGAPTTFTWRLTKDGAPVTDLRLFLEAAMHLAVVRADLGHFLHGHGMAKGIDTGYDHAHGPGAAPSEAPDLAYFGPEITATLSFPAPGRYFLFGQIAHGDALLISRIAIDVSG